MGNETQPCESYSGEPCQGIQRYEESGGTCCLDNDDRLAVLFCDRSEISLTCMQNT
jgi:hypothetical protein